MTSINCFLLTIIKGKKLSTDSRVMYMKCVHIKDIPHSCQRYTSEK